MGFTPNMHFEINPSSSWTGNGLKKPTILFAVKTAHVNTFSHPIHALNFITVAVFILLWNQQKKKNDTHKIAIEAKSAHIIST